MNALVEVVAQHPVGALLWLYFACLAIGAAIK